MATCQGAHDYTMQLDAAKEKNGSRTMVSFNKSISQLMSDDRTQKPVQWPKQANFVMLQPADQATIVCRQANPN